MSKIATDQFETVIDRSCGNLQVGIRQDGASFLKVCTDLSEHLCGCHIVGQNRYGRQNALLDVGEMTMPGLDSDRRPYTVRQLLPRW